VGKAITADMMVEIIKYELEEHTFDMTSTENCWVLDGMPHTLDQVSALKSAGLMPDFNIQMNNGT
jgi:adenylate kinase family enzyme